MDQNMSIVPVSVLDSRPISPSPVTVTMGAAPPTVESKGGDSLPKKKRARGRPRKYDSQGFLLKPVPGESSTRKSLKRRKGNDDPSMSLGSGGDFKAHMLTVNTREDIIEKIMSFTQNGTRGICVLSANGTVCNVKIQPTGFNHNALMFKDYEIISLSNGMGEWRILLGGVDGSVIGGTLAGRLIAASPVQVVIGSFWPLISNPSLDMNNESKSVIVTPTIPNTLASTSSAQVQQPETSDHEDGTGQDQDQDQDQNLTRDLIPNLSC